MAKFVGNKYTLTKNENFGEFLAAFNYPEDKIKTILALVPTITAKIEGDRFTIYSDADTQKDIYSWVLNKEMDDNIPLGFTAKSFATLNGGTLTIKSKTEDNSFAYTRTFEFSDTDVVLTLFDENGKVPTAKRFYKRV